jgi:hypothetical protein
MIDSCAIEMMSKEEDIRELLPKKCLDFNKVINQLGGKLLYVKSGSIANEYIS